MKNIELLRKDVSELLTKLGKFDNRSSENLCFLVIVIQRVVKTYE